MESPIIHAPNSASGVKDPRIKTLWDNFRMTRNEWDTVNAYQGGVCAICGKPQPPLANGKPKRLATDHSHVDGEVRGLLCSRCNPILGKLENAFRRTGLHKVSGMSVVYIARAIAHYLTVPPVQAALGRKIMGYPGRVGTKEHRKWVRRQKSRP